MHISIIAVCLLLSFLQLLLMRSIILLLDMPHIIICARVLTYPPIDEYHNYEMPESQAWSGAMVARAYPKQPSLSFFADFVALQQTVRGILFEMPDSAVAQKRENAIFPFFRALRLGKAFQTWSPPRSCDPTYKSHPTQQQNNHAQSWSRSGAIPR